MLKGFKNKMSLFAAKVKLQVFQSSKSHFMLLITQLMVQ